MLEFKEMQEIKPNIGILELIKDCTFTTKNGKKKQIEFYRRFIGEYKKDIRVIRFKDEVIGIFTNYIDENKESMISLFYIRQILICVDGEGEYQEEKEPQSLKAGDVVTILANVKHWHGAKKDSWFSHLAVEVRGENTSNEWCEPVSDEEYSRL
ncbi:MAG: cupin domain-containing protein [Clostridia bacterium]